MRRGRLGGAILALFLLVFALPVGALGAEKDGQRFPDVGAGYVLFESVEWGATHGIVCGYEDGSFHPGDALTCGAFIKMVAETFRLGGRTIAPVTQEGCFAKQIAFVREASDSRGTLDAELEEILDHPARKATRRDAITVLSALTDVTNAGGRIVMTFPDADAALMEKVTLINGGPLIQAVISGFEDGTLRPDEPLTRGQGIALCAQYYNVHLSPEAVKTDANATWTDNLWGDTADDTTAWNWGSQEVLMMLANQMVEAGHEDVGITRRVGSEFDGEIEISGVLFDESGVFVLTFYVTEDSGSYCWVFDDDVVGDILPLGTIEDALAVINAGPPDLDAVAAPEVDWGTLGEGWLPEGKDGWPDSDEGDGWQTWLFPGDAVEDFALVRKV